MSILSELKLPCSAFSAAAGAGRGRASPAVGAGCGRGRPGDSGDTEGTRRGHGERSAWRCTPGARPWPSSGSTTRLSTRSGTAGRGCGPPGSGWGIVPFPPSHLVPSLRAPVRFRPAPASLSRDFCTAHYSHGARAAPSEGAWISLCKLRAELRRNFCSFL